MANQLPVASGQFRDEGKRSAFLLVFASRQRWPEKTLSLVYYWRLLRRLGFKNNPQVVSRSTTVQRLIHRNNSGSLAIFAAMRRASSRPPCGTLLRLDRFHKNCFWQKAMTTKAELFRAKAEECEQKAKQAKNAEAKRLLMAAAEHWHVLAAQAERSEIADRLTSVLRFTK